MRKLGRLEHELICNSHRRHLLPKLDAFKRPSLPVIPTQFQNIPEHKVIAIVDAAKNAEFKTDRDRSTLKIFGLWRKKVMKYEAEVEANILFLLRAAEHFEAIDDESTAYQLISFAGTEYGFYIASAKITEEEREAIARKHSRCRAVMSDLILGDGKTPPKKESPDPSDVVPTQIKIREVF